MSLMPQRRRTALQYTWCTVGSRGWSSWPPWLEAVRRERWNETPLPKSYVVQTWSVRHVWVVWQASTNHPSTPPS